jgi:hypothetical protein
VAATQPTPASPAVLDHELWRQRCLLSHPALAGASASIDASSMPVHRGAAAAVGDAADSAAAAGGGADSQPQPQPQQQEAGAGAEAARASAFYKKLHCRLTAPAACPSLISQALAASSTDRPQVQ